VSRTTAAAPLAYLLVAGGTWAVAGAAGRALSRARAAARNTGVEGIRAGVAWSLVALISAVNLNAYFSLYEDRLPLGNAPVAGFIVQHARDLPEGSGVHLVGYGWLKGLPETKSVAYQVGDRPVVEHPPDDFGCDELDALARPAMVVWSPSSELPSPGVAACADRFDGAVVQTSASGLPLFRFVLLA
jgi:hypothetical protein